MKKKKKNGLIYFLMKPLCTAVHNKDMNRACELAKGNKQEGSTEIEVLKSILTIISV